MSQYKLNTLLKKVRACTICEAHLPFPPRPVVHMSTRARVLIVGQAPGIRVQNTGIPFNDPSGDRLRQWMGVTRQEFYDTSKFAIMPMGFCYPGTGNSGDLPPRKECAPAWHEKLREALPNIDIILAVGQYAIGYYVPKRRKTLTETVRCFREYLPVFPMPHPSPRNNIWLKKNPWFEREVVPFLQVEIRGIFEES